jgi:hypothetical protein
MQPRDKRVNSWRGGTTRSDNFTRSKALKNLLATATPSFQPRTLSLAPTGQDKTRQDTSAFSIAVSKTLCFFAASRLKPIV